MTSRWLRTFFVAAGICAQPVLAQTHPGLTFDQTVRETRTGLPDDSVPAVLHITVANGNLRVDVHGRLPGTQRVAYGNQSVLILTDTGTRLTMLNAEKKQYMSINTVQLMEGMTKMMSAMGGSMSIDTARTRVSLDTLGPGPVLDGHPTNRYRVTTSLRMTMSMMGESRTFDQQAVEDVDAATDLADLTDATAIVARFSNLGQSLGISPEFMMRIIAVRRQIRGFPIRVTKVQTVKIGEQTRNVTQYVTASNIKRIAVADSVFTVPPEYKPAPTAFPGAGEGPIRQ